MAEIGGLLHVAAGMLSEDAESSELEEGNLTYVSGHLVPLEFFKSSTVVRICALNGQKKLNYCDIDIDTPSGFSSRLGSMNESERLESTHMQASDTQRMPDPKVDLEMPSTDEEYDLSLTHMFPEHQDHVDVPEDSEVDEHYYVSAESRDDELLSFTPEEIDELWLAERHRQSQKDGAREVAEVAEPPSAQRNVVVQGKFACDVCKKTWSHKGHRDLHFEACKLSLERSEERNVGCKACNRWFANLDGRKRHHCTPPASDFEEIVHYCTLCNYQAITRHAVITHIGVCHKDVSMDPSDITRTEITQRVAGDTTVEGA